LFGPGGTHQVDRALQSGRAQLNEVDSSSDTH
jgi:hypothetical protein